MLNILHKVEDHENHVRWIYLTTILNMEEIQKQLQEWSVPGELYVKGRYLIVGTGN